MTSTFLIAPLERLRISAPELDGSRGLNRAPPNPSEPVVNTDIEAAEAFLHVHRHTPTTQRNYTTQIERLILWSINVKAKPMSSLSFHDMEEFVEFLASPEPIDVWVSTQRFPRESKDWKPFVMRAKPSPRKGEPPQMVAGIASSSRLTAMASLSSFFSWLVNYGYLIKNPMRQIKTMRKVIRAEGHKTSSDKVERFLDEEMWAAFEEAIEMLPKETQSQLDHYERAKFLAAMMLCLAPRASEVVKGRMHDFRSDGELWWWHVIGKGSKAEKIPVVDDMLTALIRYRSYLGMTPLPLSDDDSPLLRSIRDGKAISTRQLNLILDALFEDAAKLLEQKATEFADPTTKAEWINRAVKIRKASAHWGRHTSITFQVRSDIPLNLVQLNARHADLKTTGHYTHEDQKYWHKQSQKLRT